MRNCISRGPVFWGHVRIEWAGLYDADGERIDRWGAPEGFALYTLQKAPTLTPQFKIVCIAATEAEPYDWQFRIDPASGALERYSPWR